MPDLIDKNELKNRLKWGWANDKFVLRTIDEMPAVNTWISVDDRLPESGKHVLVVCEVRLFSGWKQHYVCEAFYAPTHTISVGYYPDDSECYEYDEEDDNYYLLEGWYECIHNWDEYSSVVIGDFVSLDATARAAEGGLKRGSMGPNVRRYGNPH